MDCKDSPLPRGKVLTILKNYAQSAYQLPLSRFCKLFIVFQGCHQQADIIKTPDSQNTVSDIYEKQMLLAGFFYALVRGRMS